MRYFSIVLIILTFASCQGGADKGDKAAGVKQDGVAGASQDNKPVASDGSAGATAALDTAKLQQDLNTMLSGIVSGKQDTAALKRIAARMGMTTQQILSDSGINALYGNSNDPSAKAAGDMVKKLRDAAGLTPDKLDSLKKALDVLNSN